MTNYTNTQVDELVINKMTQAEYDALATKLETELYLVPETYATQPEQNGTNPITSGAVYSALSTKANATDLLNRVKKMEVYLTAKTQDFTAYTNNYYVVTVGSSIIQIELSTPSSSDELKNIIFLINTTNASGNGSVSFHSSNSSTLYSSVGFSIGQGSIYEVNALYNGNYWYLTQVELEAATT